MGDELHSAIALLRRARGLAQAELAKRAGISRQALYALETGHSEPGTAVALRLARALDARVEEIFWLGDEGGFAAELAAPLLPGARHKSSLPVRVALAEVDGRLVAHELPAEQPFALQTAADGLLTRAGRAARARVTVRPLRSREAVRENVLAIGCDPALQLVAARLLDRAPPARLSWLHAGSHAALQALRRGEAHLAGTHLRDEVSGEFNRAAVRALFPGRAMLLVNLARWEQGLVVARGNPRRLRSAEDLAAPGVRIVNREPGSGARALLDGLLAAAGVAGSALAGYDKIAAGHFAVAQAVASGGADAGVATRAAALALGLAFVPLAEERFDLVLTRESAGDPRIARLLDTLRSRTLRRELGALPGYSAAHAGELVAELSAGEAAP